MNDSKHKNRKPSVRCSVCDRQVDHYYAFLHPADELRHVCWECQMREEKGFNAKKSFRRQSRGGYIPR